MNCSTTGCTEPATLLVRSDGANNDGVMVLVMRSGWERITGPNPENRGLYCTEHASKVLAGLPVMVLHLGGTGDLDGPAGGVYTHG